MCRISVKLFTPKFDNSIPVYEFSIVIVWYHLLSGDFVSTEPRLENLKHKSMSSYMVIYRVKRILRNDKELFIYGLYLIEVKLRIGVVGVGVCSS